MSKSHEYRIPVYTDPFLKSKIEAEGRRTGDSNSKIVKRILKEHYSKQKGNEKTRHNTNND